LCPLDVSIQRQKKEEKEGGFITGFNTLNVKKQKKNRRKNAHNRSKKKKNKRSHTAHKKE